MGPFPKLLEMGATIVAIDIPGSWGKGTKRPSSSLWKRLCGAYVSNMMASCLPFDKAGGACGAAFDLHHAFAGATPPRILPVRSCSRSVSHRASAPAMTSCTRARDVRAACPDRVHLGRFQMRAHVHASGVWVHHDALSVDWWRAVVVAAARTMSIWAYALTLPGDLMKQPGEIANWLVEWQATLPAAAKVFIGNYTYLDGDLHVKLALCADHCISRLRKARPSTGVAFLCTPTDIHVRSDASDAAARKNFGMGMGSFGLEKLANILSGGKFLVKVCARHSHRAFVLGGALGGAWPSRVVVAREGGRGLDALPIPIPIPVPIPTLSLPLPQPHLIAFTLRMLTCDGCDVFCCLPQNVDKPITADSGKVIKLVDGLSVAQGPNYALAKRLQHWRAQVEFDKGATVSSMVAPSTATISVIHNKTFAWAYGGMPYFKFEIFKQETTNAVMAAMLMHDILNSAGPKNPANKATHHVENSLELFRTQGVHGGLWHSPYKACHPTCLLVCDPRTATQANVLVSPWLACRLTPSVRSARWCTSLVSPHLTSQP